MTIVEKAAYLQGLADGLGIDPQSKEGRLWAGLSELLADMAREIEDLREAALVHADELEDLADELGDLQELAELLEEPDDDEEDEEDEDGEPEFDGVVYDATCPVCGEDISFDEQTLEKGSISCPNCGEVLEFDLGDEADAEKP